MKNKKFNMLLLLFILFLQSLFSLSYFSFNDRERNEVQNINPELSDVQVGNYTVPGISVPVPLSQLVKIGLLDDLEHFSGDHALKGALLAAKEINEADGIDIGGTTYYIGIAAEDTDECNETLDVSKGVAAANRMITYNDPHFITGGYINNSVLTYLEPIMDAQIPFLSTGVSNLDLNEKVNESYNKYKYLFRVMPMNISAIITTMIFQLGYMALNLSEYYTGYPLNMNKSVILRPDAAWAELVANIIKNTLSGFLIYFETDIVFPVDADEDYFNPYWESIDSAGVQLTIPLVTSHEAIAIAKSYRANKPKCLLAGLNTWSNLESYWDDTEGACQYEIMMQAIHRTPKTSLTIPFWDSYVDTYNMEPYFTGVGSYDAVRLLANVSDSINSFDSNDTVSRLEGFNKTNPFKGVSSNIAFTNLHDFYVGYPYGFSLFCQWQLDGKKVVIPAYDIPPGTTGYYPNSLATGSISVPYWGINNLVDAQDLPGNFTLNSTAESPDPDGSFYLDWSSSTGADNYSVYLYDKPITYIHKNLTLLANQNATKPFSISGLESGDYFIVVVAYNETGETFSNSIQIRVEIPPGPFTLSSDAGTPDIDGIFNLTWDISTRADNYSVFIHNRMITEINNSVTILANQTALSPFPVSGLETNIYYFVILAYNRFAYTNSNCISVDVQIFDESSGYWILNPIIIDDSGNGDYTWSQVAILPWCSGSGTSGNPYILEFLKIDGKNSGNCILIKNSSIYFEISNSIFYNSGSSSQDGGLKLVSVSNGKLISNNCSQNNANGIVLDSCQNIDISDNTVEENERSGILLLNSNNIKINNNNETISDNGRYGIHLDNSDNNEITGNTINYNEIGIYFDESDDNTITNNDLRYNDKPYEEVSSTGNTFEDNQGIIEIIETPPFPFDIIIIIVIIVIVIIGVISAAFIIKKRISIPEKEKKELSESQKEKIRRKLKEKLNYVDDLIEEKKINLAYKNLGKVKDKADQYELFDIFNIANEKVEICKEIEAGIYREVKREELITPAVEREEIITPMVEREVKEDKEVIQALEKAKEFNVFLSYSTSDADHFQINRIVQHLERFPEIKRVYYYSKDSGQNIVEYMEKTLSVCNTFVLFCSERSKKSKSVEGEWQSAYQLVKRNVIKIIPVYENEEDIPILLITMLNVKYDKDNFNEFIKNLYHEILR